MVQQTLADVQRTGADGEFEPIHRRRLPVPPPGPDPRDPAGRRIPPAPALPDDAAPLPQEQDLLVRLRDGDELAFARLYEMHWDGVLRVLVRVLGDADVARDVAQEVFVQLFRHPPEHAGAPLRAWLYRVAINRGYNELRASRRRRSREDAAFDPTTGQASGALDDQAVAEAVNRAEERALVRRVLLSLQDRQREVLLLRLEGLSYAEIAATVGVVPGSVGTLLARAERAFKQAYQAQRGGM
jgi:RNA polymerase sigma-70 factor (ECF subfamily)